jgi:hypothetical protein
MTGEPSKTLNGTHVRIFAGRKTVLIGRRIVFNVLITKG